MPRKRTDLNGLRVKTASGKYTYVVDQGQKRWIPNPIVYSKLFQDWEGILTDIDIDEIETGEPISGEKSPLGAFLFQCPDDPSHRDKIYLKDKKKNTDTQWVKRHIVSLDVFALYHFNANNIERFRSLRVADLAWGDGAPIVKPTEP